MWLMANTDVLMFEYADARPISQIVADWENAETIERKSEAEGDLTYNGYTKIQSVVCRKTGNIDTVQITLVKGDADGNGD